MRNETAVWLQAAELKFNCFFLMPVIDVFPMKLREELEVAYDADLDAVFDIQAVRFLSFFPPLDPTDGVITLPSDRSIHKL